MGCDIHLYCEYKNKDGIWITADRFKYNQYESKFEVDSVYSDRWYALFAKLADVRNNGEIEPICQPRDLPTDVNRFIREAYDCWGNDAHSASWLTLQELYDAQDNSSITRFNGYISPEDAERLDKGLGTPEIWCLRTSNSYWVYRSWEDKVNLLDYLIEKVESRAKNEFWIFDKKNRIPKKEAENFRVVFWFDN